MPVGFGFFWLTTPGIRAQGIQEYQTNSPWRMLWQLSMQGKFPEMYSCRDLGMNRLPQILIKTRKKLSLNFVPQTKLTILEAVCNRLCLAFIYLDCCSGMNGDTMNGVGRSFLEAGLKANGGMPLALEPEVLYSNVTDLQFDVMSWGYWTNFLGFVPINPIIPPVKFDV